MKRIFAILLLSLFASHHARAQSIVIGGVQAGGILASASPRSQDETVVGAKCPSWNFGLSIQKINEKGNHLLTGITLFNETVKYDPFVYADQSVKVNHMMLFIPMEFGWHLKSPSLLLRMGIPLEFDGALLLRQNTKIFVNGELKEQGEGLIFPTTRYNYYMQTGFYADYQLSDKLEISGRLRLGASGLVVFYNKQAELIMFSGLDCGLHYYLN